MRISDWSSDVCSSDLRPATGPHGKAPRPESSTPTRKSGDRPRSKGPSTLSDCDAEGIAAAMPARAPRRLRSHHPSHCKRMRVLPGHRAHARVARAARSEEHTSELQSLMRISYAVFCLKKKKNKYN